MGSRLVADDLLDSLLGVDLEVDELWALADPPTSELNGSATDSIGDGGVAHRKRIAVRAGAEIPFNRQEANPKQAFRVVLCRLMEDPEDEIALQYIPIGLRFRDKGDTFGKSALSRIYCQFGDVLPESTREQIFDEVTTYEGWLTGGTENHIAMRRTAGFLFGEAFPKASFAQGLTGAELAAECFRYFKEYGRLLYQSSMTEFLSPIYHSCHTATWLNVYDFAKDPQAKLCARAILDWMFADLATNSHHGIIIPPATRAKGLMTDSYQLSTVRSNTQWSAWLYWGAGNVKETYEAVAGTTTWKQSPFTLHAVSDYVPERIVRNLGAKRVDTPYRLFQSRANKAAIDPPSINPYGKTASPYPQQPDVRYATRSVYVHKNYAIGAGTRKAEIDEPTVRHAHTFGVIWKDTHPRNWLFVVHPYWYVNRPDEESGELLGADDWSGTSPFLQMVHWENAALLLADLPEKDPYHGQAVGSNPKWISDRPAELHRQLNVFVPATVEQALGPGGGVFLRTDDVYISLRPIGGEAIWEETCREGYRRLAVHGKCVGYTVEVGDADEYGTFDAFREQIASCELDVTELSRDKHVRYHSSRGHALDLHYDESSWRPNAHVNGTRVDYDRWPICESPYLTCRDGVMHVNDGQHGMRVDWSCALPEYTYYSSTQPRS